jgi:hypothetical protein
MEMLGHGLARMHIPTGWTVCDVKMGWHAPEKT